MGEKHSPFIFITYFWAQGNIAIFDPIDNRFWRLSLPIGGTKDHPLMNPFGPSSPKLAEVNLNPMLVVVGSDEILKDRVEDYAKKLKELGKKIEFVEFEGKQHGFFTDHPFSEVAERVILIIKGFMAENSD